MFLKPSKRGDLPLRLPRLQINNIAIKHTSNIKFLGVILDENLSWREHINVIQSKISKNIGIIRKAKPFLNIGSLKKSYFSFIHSYLNYCNIAWASTNPSKTKKLFSKQKQVCRLIFNENRYAPSHPLLLKLRALDVYKLNIHQILTFIFKSKFSLTPNIFKIFCWPIQHKYHTRYSKNNFRIPKTKS